MSDIGDSGQDYVTAMVGGELIGLPILRVQDVFAPQAVTHVPLAPPEIAGVINLRGRIVTLIDLRCRFGMPPRERNAPVMAIGVETATESFGLVIDSIGEVLRLSGSEREPNPLHLDPSLARLSSGIHRLEGRLLMVIDIDRVLDIETAAAAAA
jgi:purine-binding chemotaxis protein CheW